MRVSSRAGVVLAGSLGLGLGLGLGCTTGSVFSCESASDCDRSSGGGVCQPEGYCSFPDDACPSGQRYGDYAGDGLAGECVPLPDGTGPGSTGPITTVTANDESSSGDPPLTTSDDGTTTSTTEPPGTDSTGEPECGAVGQPCCDGSCSEGVCTPRGCAPCSAVVVADEYVTCSVRSDGELHCWGLDEFGQVGDGPPAELAGVPLPVSVASGVSEVDIGAFHVCALADGPWCWGRDDEGQLGLGAAGPEQLVPAAVMAPEPLTTITAGGFHTCALGAAGSAYCWGRNQNDQLGFPGPDDVASPQDVPDPTDLVDVDAGGFHTCAIDAAGEAWCWGRNDYGQLGRVESTSSPEPVLGLPPVQQIALGDYHSCALDLAGAVWCWGRSQLAQTGGPASPMPVLSPQLVEGLPLVDGLASGDDHACAWSTGGPAWCWGSDEYGQLAGPSGGVEPSPIEMPFGDVLVVDGGRGHTCATTTEGSILCMGAGGVGQLGDGSAGSSPRPVPAVGVCP